MVSISESQRKAARVVGAAYLGALLPAIFAELYVRGQLVVAGNAAQTALNVVAHERLFRPGIASNLAVFAIDIALIAGLYLILEPVDRGLALLGLGWGIIETAVLVVVTLRDLDVLQILSGARYLNTFTADHLHALARLSIGAHAATYNVGLVFSGLRGLAFCSLWLRSGYVPRSLAAWGLAASFLMGASAFSFIVAPQVAQVVPVELYGGPIFFFELAMGVWLLIKGLRTAQLPVPPAA